VVRDDLTAMSDAGINSVRTYHLPPDWLLHALDERGMTVLVDVPWPKHSCFLDTARSRRRARRLVRHAAATGAAHPCVLGYSIANEIPPDIVRWYGAARVERFLAELADVAKQADPDGLVTYANYPPTEYLDLSFLDFVTFNVYLHDPETFRRYLLRLQNLVGDRPLVLGEIGMDTLRHGELAQAEFLAGHARESFLAGLAGLFVFSWTDDWHTGGSRIDDWAFGVTRADRSPKASYHALREVFTAEPSGLLAEAPRVSVVVCTYNGGRTLAQCLRSLAALDYPDYEVIVVDDGSTDDTRAVLGHFPNVRAIHQPNRGLSTARNVGLQAASGEVIAYTDSDCFADPDWLTHLVHQLLRTGATGVGGPNLSPDDGRLAACVGASPGQPTHVLESDQVAEHVPGCNMAFRREALETINGFDPQFRRAGDDVDLCWRLQQAGHWITFAPGGFVWHHRRQTPRTYLRQQQGYGEAEALLRFKHPDKFDGRGNSRWRGVLYGPSLKGLYLAGATIYRGTFATGLFQCVYQPGPAHWAMLPVTLEWHLVAAVLGLAGLFWSPAWIGVGAFLALSLLVAALQASQAQLPPRYDGLRSRLVVMFLSYAQPLVRSFARYRTRFLSDSTPAEPTDAPEAPRLPASGATTVAYWADGGRDRKELLDAAVDRLTRLGWGKETDSGWSEWDLEVHCDPWTVVQVCTVQEEHGGGRRCVRVRYRLRPSWYLRLLGLAIVLAGGATLASLLRPGGEVGAALPAAGALIVLACAGLWWRGTARAARAVTLIDAVARELGMIRLAGMPAEDKTGEHPSLAPVE
jgi:GT2 family glycosyltransferase